MIVRARAPYRLGLAGGGTDIASYSDIFGGCVLNATINLFANTFILDSPGDTHVVFESKDLKQREEYKLSSELNYDSGLILHKAVYDYVMIKYNDGVKIPISVVTHAEVPAGSGLGSSSTLVVSMLEAFRCYLNIPLGEYDVANAAYEIEREICGLAGGKQDQYAATFGGFNFMEFGPGGSVIINPLRIRRKIVSELEVSVLLYFLGASRSSASIIEDQVNSILSAGSPLDAMHRVKASAIQIKTHLLRGDIDSLMAEFKTSWENKKATSTSITNSLIASLEDTLEIEGARAFKVSGAGGGGFMMAFVDPTNRLALQEAITKKHGGIFFPFQFTDKGAHSWKTT
jgi:D-glycero-alpha-D-manno-heptose-7-phosphate kinase